LTSDESQFVISPNSFNEVTNPLLSPLLLLMVLHLTCFIITLVSPLFFFFFLFLFFPSSWPNLRYHNHTKWRGPLPGTTFSLNVAPPQTPPSNDADDSVRPADLRACGRWVCGMDHRPRVARRVVGKEGEY